MNSDSFVVTPLKFAESKILNLLVSRKNQVVTRDEVAQAMWGLLWLDKYSDTVIDTLIYRIRKKLKTSYKLHTIRNRGFMFHPEDSSSQIINHLESVLTPPPCIYPPQSYIDYMNNPGLPRLTLYDLFVAFDPSVLSTTSRILIIDSYSVDNIDTIATKFPHSEIYFSGFDERVLELHRQRIRERGFKNIQVLYDDIRSSHLKSSCFDLVINDFRLNFNTTHEQNLQSLSHIYRMLVPAASCLVSVVVDARYESARFGNNQEKAPLNLHSPWQFAAAEQLPRFCYTVPYYKKIFTDTGFSLTQEFDIEKGKTWANIFTPSQSLGVPFFRRFLLQKV